MNFDNTQALSEGWDLVSVDWHFQVQRIDCPTDHEGLSYTEPKFQSDVDAIIEVAMRAKEGSAYHREALSLVGHLSA